MKMGCRGWEAAKNRKKYIRRETDIFKSRDAEEWIMSVPRLPHMDKRIVVVDEGTNPPRMLTNCLTCNRLTNELDSEGLMCLDCLKKWKLHYARNCVLGF